MSSILYQVQNNVAYITLNRPESYNAFLAEMIQALTEAFQKAGADKAVRAVCLTGAGEKAFCAGQDVKNDADFQGVPELGKAVRERYNPLIVGMRNLEKPIICKLNGVAAGAGCSLVLACDMIIAADHAILMEAFINIGLVLDSGSSFFLPRMAGSLKAFEWCTMGNKISATEAEKFGLVNKVVSKDKLDEATEAVLDYYRKAPTKAIGLIKTMLNHSYHSDLETMLEYEAVYQDEAGKSADHQEGVAAFREKRKPDFKGE
ncbi:UNVERIFIED_CONTAM: hypothetical protein GTU68_011689 [Idotea baltica]|nr:hypothetical protein [Idotea baltica]